MKINTRLFLYNNKIILQKKTIEVCRNFAANISNIAREDLLEDTTYNATNSAVTEILKSDIEGFENCFLNNISNNGGYRHYKCHSATHP